MLLIKNKLHVGNCEIKYYDIGDYHSREEKLKLIQNFGSISEIAWSELCPNQEGDWIKQRNSEFENFIPIGDKVDLKANTIFETYSAGVKTNRDNWCYNHSASRLNNNMESMIGFYNQQLQKYETASIEKKVSVDDFVDNDPKKISWSYLLKIRFTEFEQGKFDSSKASIALYRPFEKKWMYFDRMFNENQYLIRKIKPTPDHFNLCFGVTGRGSTKDFSTLITDQIPDLEFISKSQCFPLYFYVKINDPKIKEKILQEEKADKHGYVRRDTITDVSLKRFRTTYKDEKISKEDIFYYIYGLLHSNEYKNRFKSDLLKMLPRIMFAENFWLFSNAGRALADLHLNYETVEPFPLEEVSSKPSKDLKSFYKVSKMRFPKKDDKSTIIYNGNVTLKEIPLEAYDYIVNGKSAIEWIMERYQVKTDKDSGILNDPNEYSNDPRYIIDLVKRIVRLSLETKKIVDSLPLLSEIN
jgi:predicted helicase